VSQILGKSGATHLGKCNAPKIWEASYLKDGEASDRSKSALQQPLYGDWRPNRGSAARGERLGKPKERRVVMPVTTRLSLSGWENLLHLVLVGHHYRVFSIDVIGHILVRRIVVVPLATIHHIPELILAILF
jgi:hypothetical protein